MDSKAWCMIVKGSTSEAHCQQNAVPPPKKDVKIIILLKIINSLFLKFKSSIYFKVPVIDKNAVGMT